MTNLKERFIGLAQLYIPSTTICENYWKEIEIAYTEKNRHYHNLHHLKHMCIALDSVSYTHLTLPTKA